MTRRHHAGPRGLVFLLAAAGACIAPPLAAHAQEPAAGARDTIRLPALQDDAVHADPRAAQPELQAAQTALRLRTIAAERLPALRGEAQAQYQSDVVRIPIRLPNGEPVAGPPHDTYDAYLGVQESIVDPTLGPRRAVERARLAESQAQVRSTLYGVRSDVNADFFAAALLDARRREITAAIGALEARLAEARARVREGTSLPSDTATIAAALLERRQDSVQALVERGAALSRLSELVARPIGSEVVTALPDLDSLTARVRAALARSDSGDLRSRPEYQAFDATRERLSRQAAVDDASRKPRLSAFARGGYGRPGLDVLGTKFDTYWLAGVRVSWAPWDWGSAGRDREELALQQRIVQANESAFTLALRRAVAGDFAAIDRLTSALRSDDQIIALRERVERETAARLREGAATGAEYVDRSTELLSARLARATDRVELTQAQAHLLTTIGVEIR